MAGTTQVLVQGQAPAFIPELFEQAIDKQGVELIHYRAFRCPVGLTDMHSMRRPGPHDHTNCDNGFLYERVGIIKGLFTGVSDQHRETQMGMVENSEAQVTVQRYYEDNEDVPHVAPFDRFYILGLETTVVTWQLFEAHATGRDRLQYPAVLVEHLVDADGKEYQLGDFQIVQGQIVWGANRPRFDANLGKGIVCSVRFRYQPYYYCSRLLHQTRIAQVQNIDGRVVVRMPQALAVSREYTFRDVFGAPEEAGDRAAPAPESGTFGAR